MSLTLCGGVAGSGWPRSGVCHHSKKWRNRVNERIIEVNTRFSLSTDN